MVHIDDISVMASLKRRMQYLSERQVVLAQNVANADTPGYKPKDLKKISFRQEVDAASGKLRMTATAPQHIQPATGGGRFATMTSGDSFETTPSGNGVILEEEMLKMNKTATDYQTTTALYRKLTNLLNTAIDGGK